jgi:hypothetical protein
MDEKDLFSSTITYDFVRHVSLSSSLGLCLYISMVSAFVWSIVPFPTTLTWNFHLCPNGEFGNMSPSCPVVNKT